MQARWPLGHSDICNSDVTCTGAKGEADLFRGGHYKPGPRCV